MKSGDHLALTIEHSHREVARDVLQCSFEMANFGFGGQDELTAAL